MPRFAANLTYLFRERPILHRFSAAADAGFEAVEILYPYDVDPQDLSRAAQATGLPIILLNSPPPNWSGGARGFAAVPGLEARFRMDFDHALRVAQALKVWNIHVCAGKTGGEAARQTFINNLRWAAERAPHANLTIKPASRSAVPGYFLNSFRQASDIILEVGAKNLAMQLDTFHAQSITGDVIGTWRKYADQIRHIQIAGFPNRDEPFVGKINFPAFFDALDDGGYQGWVSARYDPVARTDLGLGWLNAMSQA